MDDQWLSACAAYLGVTEGVPHACDPTKFPPLAAVGASPKTQPDHRRRNGHSEPSISKCGVGGRQK